MYHRRITPRCEGITCPLTGLYCARHDAFFTPRGSDILQEAFKLAIGFLTDTSDAALAAIYRETSDYRFQSFLSDWYVHNIRLMTAYYGSRALCLRTITIGLISMSARSLYEGWRYLGRELRYHGTRVTRTPRQAVELAKAYFSDVLLIQTP